MDPQPAPHEAPATARSRTRTATIGVLAGVGALALAGTAYAATTSPTPSPPGWASSDTEAGPPAMGNGGTEARRGPGGHHGRGGFGGPGMGIHGTFVVPKADGGYQTVHTQRGEVTAVSSSSITLRSEDGYTLTYTVTAETIVKAQRDGIDSLAVGDDVRILGIETDGVVTAVQISDKDRIQKGLKRLAPPTPDSDTDTDTDTDTDNTPSTSSSST